MKISILKDALVATGEHLKDSKIILITLGGLTEDYELFLTSNTTRFNHSMSSSSLYELFMDQEMRVQKVRLLSSSEINAAMKSESKSVERENHGSTKSMSCQIYTCKEQCNQLLFFGLILHNSPRCMDDIFP